MVDPIRRLFTEHPATVGETYAQHLGAALRFSALMLSGAAACFLHAIVPALFRTAGSDRIERLHAEMVATRRNAARAESSAFGAPPS